MHGQQNIKFWEMYIQKLTITSSEFDSYIQISKKVFKHRLFES